MSRCLGDWKITVFQGQPSTISIQNTLKSLEKERNKYFEIKVKYGKYL